jgi:hypothetical protein
VLVGAAVVVALVAAGIVVGWRALSASAYQQALGTMPADTLRASFTDWAAVRARLGGGPGPDAGRGATGDFLDRAYDADLTATSALAGSVGAMQEEFGFSPLTARWEVFGQARDGAVVALRLPDDADYDGIEATLRTLGYDAPADGPGSGGVWRGSTDLTARIDGSLTPVMDNVVVLADAHLVLLSDDAGYASSTADVVTGDADSLIHSAEVADLAGTVAEPVTALLWASDFACEDLNMASAGSEDQALAARLVQRAGGVDPLSGMLLARTGPRKAVVALEFADGEQARENLRPRTRLATGEAVGQGGLFTDRFRVTSAETQGSTVVLHLRVAPDEALVSDLARGPVLFAAC